MGIQEISPRVVMRRIWEIYSDHVGVLVGTAIILFAVQAVIALLLSGALVVLVILVFWALSTLYQGMVVELCVTSRTGDATTLSASCCAA
jgi:sugar phosphate permease